MADIDLEWIKETFAGNQENTFLIRYQYAVHKMPFAELLLSEFNVQQIMVPAGRTGKYQPLDVGVNRPFKLSIDQQYHEWGKNHKETTGGGLLRKPGRH